MDDSRTVPSIASTSEIALPADLVEAARDFARASHARRKQETYARWWGDFTRSCAAKGISAVPAAAETIAVWMSALAVGEHGRKPLARASINQALSAVIIYHRNAGYPFDRKHPVIARTWAGISRIKAKTDTVRKAKPLLASDLRDLIEKLRPEVPIEARDAALLSLGWAGALRRSELVGLDWQQRGAGAGFVVIDDRGISITLMTSKASQDAAEQIVVPQADMPASCHALEAWASLAALEPRTAGIPPDRPARPHQRRAPHRRRSR
jgi:integrase